jgi:hypothetical protein
MARISAEERRRQAEQRIEKIREQIMALEHLCTGSLVSRTKLCGKPTCRCATDPSARHGPYFEWSRLEKGRMVHRVLTREQAALIRRAIAAHRTIRLLLRRWERETLRVAGIKPTALP